MPIFIARIYRIVPLIVVLIVVAIAVFAYVATTRNGTKAKEVVLKMFWWISAIGSALFLLATLYAVVDKSQLGVDLFATCLAMTLFTWLIDVICGKVFEKHHPHYRVSPTRPKAKTKD